MPIGKQQYMAYTILITKFFKHRDDIRIFQRSNEMNRKAFSILMSFVLLIAFGVIGVSFAQTIIDTTRGDTVSRNGDVTNGYIANSESLPTGSEVDAIKKVIEQGWILRYEAGLSSNKELEEKYKDELQLYFSDEKKPEKRVLERELELENPEKFKTLENQSPLAQLDLTASELERQKAYIDNGRYVEKMEGFLVLDFGVNEIQYKRIELDENKAEVVVDIIFWSKYSYTNPDGENSIAQPIGGNQHTFKLVRGEYGWKITEDSFVMIPGYEP
jgi:hypothetical protein